MIGRRFFAAALAATMLTPSPAAAQSSFMADVIGATVANMAANRQTGPTAACLAGQGLPARRFERVRVKTTATMRAYLASAGAAAPADASAAFTRDEQKREWLSGGTLGAVAAVDDPLARALAAGAARLERPGWVVAAGDGRSALATWRVFAVADGALLGHYRVGFARESGDYMIRRLELVEGPMPPARIPQYCQEPGDVERYAAWAAGGKVGAFEDFTEPPPVASWSAAGAAAPETAPAPPPETAAPQ